MQIKAVILDFDGTLITADISDVLAGLAGKRAESEELDRQFKEGKLTGLTGLIQRVNFMQGLSLEEIRAVAKDEYIRKGAYELFEFLNERGIVSIIASGSIVPILEVYQEKFGADYVVGSKPIIEDGKIVSISEAEYSGADFKVRDCTAILEKLGIPHSAVIAIGDSPADKGIFELSEASIAIDPKGDIGQYADYVVQEDLGRIIPILESLILAQ